MGAEIDSLEIKLQANAQSANRSLDALVKKLDVLSTSLGRVNGDSLTSLSNGVANLGSSVRSFNDVKTADFTKIANGLTKFTKISSGSLWNAAYAIGGLAKNLGTLNGVSFDASGLSNIANAVSKFGSKMSTQATANLPSISNDLSNFVKGLNEIGSVTFDSTGLANLVSSVSKLGGEKATQAARNLPAISVYLKKFVADMNGVGGVTFDLQGLSELVGGISRLGGKASTQAIKNIPSLATAMKQLMATLSNVPSVSQNLIDMTNALSNLARTGASSGRAANSLSNSLNTYTASTSRARKGTLSLASAIGKLYAGYWILFRALSKIGEAIDISSDLTEVQNVVDVTFGDMAYKVEEFAETSIEQFGMSELALKQYASRFQAMGSAMGIDKSLIANANSFLSDQTNGYIGLSDSMSDVSLNLTKLTADMASFYNMEQSDVAEDLESIFTGQTRPLRTYGLDLTEATLKEWAFKNGLDADIDSMSQAEKTMLRYQYVLANTGAAQGDFARTADTWANQVRILKQNFQQLASVIGGTFINALKPLVRALNAAMSHIIAFAETISNALGKIFGWKYESGGGGVASDFEDAAGSADDIADSTGDAAKNIDKMQKGIRAFDELKTISISDSNSSSDSGSGSGSSSGGSADGGQWVEQESIFDTFESEIDTLYELGEYIGEVLTNAMNDINWESVYQGARNFGTGLAEFLNGLISPELFGATGRTIAGALNTAIYAALSFGETFDWYDFGDSIAEGINEFFETFDFGALATTLNTWVDGLEETIGSAIENMDWGEILKGLNEFFSNLEFDTVAVIIGTMLLKKIGRVTIKGAIKNFVATKVASFFGQFSLSNIPIIFASFVPKFQGTAGFDVVADWIITGIEDAMDKLLPDWVNDFIGKLAFGFTTFGVASGGNPLVASIGALITSFPIEINWFGEGGVFSFDWAYEWFDEAKRAFQTAFDGNRNDLMDIGGWILEGILDGFVGAIVFIFEPIGRLFNEIFNGICEIFGIHSPAKEMMPLGKYILLGIVEGFTGSFGEITASITELWDNYIKPWFTAEKWFETGTHLKEGFEQKWEEFMKWFAGTAVVHFWEENVKPKFSTEYWVSKLGSVREAYDKKWSEMTKWFYSTAIVEWWGKVQTNFSTANWLSRIGSIKDAMSTKWNEFKQWWDGLTIKFPQVKVPTFKINGGFSFNPPTVPSISVEWPQYKTGGFPEDGIFMANHSELVGKFANGKTAVANNEQITQGISDAVYRGNQENNLLVREEITLLQKQNELLLGILQKETGISENDIFNSVRKSAKEYSNRTGNPAFI